jgi:phosphohistidine phosphatase
VKLTTIMQLYLVQHGHAVPKEVDPDRPLSPEGEEAVRRLSTHMKMSGITLNRICHSGKMRARQTAEVFADDLLTSGEAEVIDGINPKDSVKAFARVIPEFKTATMIVGHLPFMAKLVTYLVTGNEEPVIVAYQPGSVVCLEEGEEGQWRICYMLRPDNI